MMSLTNRLLTHLLLFLVLLLAGFSTGVFLLVNNYLHRELDERVTTAMNVLVGSLDIEIDTVEWEPRDRSINLPHGPLGENIDWVITDVRGNTIDHSKTSAEFDRTLVERKQPDFADYSGKLVNRGQLTAIRKLIKANQTTDANIFRERTAEEVEKEEYPALLISVGMLRNEVANVLRSLAIGLLAISVILWAVCFAVGRWLCRRALSPVTKMAAAAGSMTHKNLDRRLPEMPAGDELGTMSRVFNELLDRLQLSFEQQRRFTGDASHQLRTPLTILRGHLEVMLKQRRSPEEYEQLCQILLTEVKRLQELSDQLLLLARSDSDTAPPQLERVNLTSWLADFRATLKSVSRGNDFEFLELRPGPIHVLANVSVLNEIVRNLVDNAEKYSPLGTPITIEIVEQGDRRGIRVTDRGAGVAKADQAKIFEPFFRAVSTSAKVKGTGLGLAIAARLAAAMGGEISLAGGTEAGSQFTVWLLRE